MLFCNQGGGGSNYVVFSRHSWVLAETKGFQQPGRFSRNNRVLAETIGFQQKLRGFQQLGRFSKNYGVLEKLRVLAETGGFSRHQDVLADNFSFEQKLGGSCRNYGVFAETTGFQPLGRSSRNSGVLAETEGGFSRNQGFQQLGRFSRNQGFQQKLFVFRRRWNVLAETTGFQQKLWGVSSQPVSAETRGLGETMGGFSNQGFQQLGRFSRNQEVLAETMGFVFSRS